MKNIILLLFLFASFNANSVTRFFDNWTSDDANQDLTLTPTGTGVIKTSNDVEMRFYDSLGAFIGLKSSGVTADQTYVLPPTDGSAGHQLSTDGSGNMTWVAPLTVPSGTQGSVIFLNALGGLDEDPTNFFWDKAGTKLSLGTDTAFERFTIVGTSGNSAAAGIYSYVNNPSGFPTFRMSRARGSEAAPTRVFIPDIIAKWDTRAHTGINHAPSSFMQSVATENFSGTTGAANLEFHTNPITSAAPLLALTLNDDQTASFTGAIDSTAINITSTSEHSTPCPSMTEVQRDALTASSAGCIFNSDTGKWNTYNGTSWGEAGGGELNTGLKTGGDLAIGAPTTTFSISDGSGVVVDTHTNPAVPVITDVVWTGLTNIVVTSLAANFTSIGIDSFGNVIQKADAFFTTEERRDTILLGALITISHVAVDSVAPAAQLAFGGLHNLYDLGIAIGPVSSGGNVYSGNGVNLNIDRTSGSTFSFGSNYSTTKKSPNVISQTSAAALSFNYTYQDGIGGYTVGASTALIDPTKWDDGTGVLNTVNANNWSIKRIYFLPHTGASFIHYGQEEYGNFNQAVDGLNTEIFTVNPDLSRSLLRAFLLVRGGATDLTNTADAVFVEADKFGQSALGGVGAVSLDLQAAYDNSTQPQIVLDATRNGVEVRDNSTPIGVSLLAVQDNAGTTDFFDVTAAKTTIGPILDINGDTNLLAEGELRLQDAAGGEYTGFKAPTTLSGSQVYTLPDGDGSAGQALKTDGAGTLDWGEASVATTDLIYVEKFNGKAAPFSMTSGNNATFDNGGALSGTLAAETVAPLNGDTSFKYTQAAGSLNDWIKSEAITTGLREQTNSLWVSFWYTYDGANDDIQIVGYDSTNSVIASSSIALIEKATTSTYFEFELPVASTTTSISWGIHTKVLNSGKILLIDDVEFSLKNKIKNQTIRQTLNFSESGNTLADRNNQVRFSGALTDSDLKGPSVLRIVDNAGSTRTDFKCIVTVCYITADANGLSDTGDAIQFLVNGSAGQSKGTEATTGNFLGGSATFEILADEVFSVGVRNGNVSNTGTAFIINIVATATSPHIVTSTDAPKTYTEANGDFTITGAGWTTTRASAVYYMAGDQHRLKFNIAGARASGASITTYVATFSGVTFKNVANYNQPVSMSATNLTSGSNVGHAIANPNASTITAEFSSNNPLRFSFSGDVEVEDIPLWAVNVSGRVGLAIPGDQAQTKLLTASVSTTGVVANLTFDNLTVGRWYVVSGLYKMQDTGSGLINVKIYIEVDNGATKIAQVRFNNELGSANIQNFAMATSPNYEFRAEATTLTFEVSSISSALLIGGSGKSSTYITLRELANVIETKKF